MGVKESARRVKATKHQVSRLRAALGLPARPIEAMMATGRRSTSPPKRTSESPSEPLPVARIAPAGLRPVPTAPAAPSGPASVPPSPVPDKLYVEGTPGLSTKAALKRYGRRLRQLLPVEARVTSLVEMATQDANPQARMRALERADQLSGFVPEESAPPDPTPLFTLPLDTQLPFPPAGRCSACETSSKPFSAARDAGLEDLAGQPVEQP